MWHCRLCHASHSPASQPTPCPSNQVPLPTTLPINHPFFFLPLSCTHTLRGRPLPSLTCPCHLFHVFSSPYLPTSSRISLPLSQFCLLPYMPHLNPPSAHYPLSTSKTMPLLQPSYTTYSSTHWLNKYRKFSLTPASSLGSSILFTPTIHFIPERHHLTAASAVDSISIYCLKWPFSTTSLLGFTVIRLILPVSWWGCCFSCRRPPSMQTGTNSWSTSNTGRWRVQVYIPACQRDANPRNHHTSTVPPAAGDGTELQTLWASDITPRTRQTPSTTWWQQVLLHHKPFWETTAEYEAEISWLVRGFLLLLWNYCLNHIFQVLYCAVFGHYIFSHPK